MAPADTGQSVSPEAKPVDQASGGTVRVADLPYSRGQTFASLDAYLDYLERYNGPIDMPWWRQISPGVYRWETTMHGGPEPEVVTRAELEKRYGFSD